jgi:uncharacterized protein YukE
MSEFSVKPTALEQYAGVLAGGSGGVNLEAAFSSTAASYVDSYCPVPYDSGDLFAEIYQANRSVVSHLQAAMPQIAKLCADSSAALSASARDYRTTDAEEAARIDRLWPGVGTATALTDSPSGGAVADPTPALAAEPSKDAPIPDMVHWVIDKSGWVSISGSVLKIAQLFGLDPVKELTQAVVGDYDELAQAGHAAEALADFERAAADAMSGGLAAMIADWTGHAADAATSYFHELANALHAHADELDELGQKYAMLVQTCAQIAELLSSALTTAIDDLLICAAELAAAGCLASVPGINVIAGIIGAYQVWKTQQSVALFLKYTGNVTTAVEGFLGLTTWIVSAFQDGSPANSFPASPYYNGALA